MAEVHARVAGQHFELDAAEVARRLRDAMPEPLGDLYVVVNGRRFPPKQALSLVTGLDRSRFNSHHAAEVLRRLGFTVSRRSDAASAPGAQALTRSAAADALRPFAGQWVAQRGDEVLVAADTPQAVLAWLERHNRQADAMFRVPRDEDEATGVAPA